MRVFSRETFPEDWAATQRNLGLAASDLFEELQSRSSSNSTAAISERIKPSPNEPARSVEEIAPAGGPYDPRLDLTEIKQEVRVMSSTLKKQSSQNATWAIMTMVLGAILGWLLSLLGTPVSLLHIFLH